MFIVINNIAQLNAFLEAAGITTPDEIVELLSDKNIIVSPNVANVILEAA